MRCVYEACKLQLVRHRPRGHRDWKKRPKVDFRCKLGWAIDFWRSRGSGVKIEWDNASFIFRGKFFFLFCFRLIDPLRIFFKKNLGKCWTNYHVIFPYIDAFDTYIVTGAWNTKPCTSHSTFIIFSQKLQKLISQPNLHLKSTLGLFFQSRCPLGIDIIKMMS